MSQSTPASQENTDEQVDRIKVLSNEIRRLLLGLLYSEGPMYHADLARHLGIKSTSLLTYHLDLLVKAKLIEKSYSNNREGQNFSKYAIKEDGERFLELIGAKNELKPLSQARKDIHRERSSKSTHT